MDRPTEAALAVISEALDPPMAVATLAVGGERSGCLVGFHTQCSIDPVRFLVCLSDKNHTYRVSDGAQTLALHLLKQSERHLAELFGAETGDDVDKFARCKWVELDDGTPLLDGASDWVAGRILERIPLGDHVGFLVEVTQASAGDDESLLHLSDVCDMEPGHEA